MRCVWDRVHRGCGAVAGRSTEGCGCLAVVWKLSGSCLVLDRRSWVAWRLSGGCLVVVWSWTGTVDWTGAADFVGGVSVTGCIAGAVR